MVRLEEFDIPTCDSFEGLLEEVRRRATDESEVERLLTEIVARRFAMRLTEDFRVKNEAKLTLEKKNKREEKGVSVEIFDVGHFTGKGKRSMRKRAAKIPDSIIQFIRRLHERGSGPAVDRASSSRNREEKEGEQLLVVPTKKRKILSPHGLEVNAGPEPDMPGEFKAEIERMNGVGIVFVMEKSLMDTDINKQNNRLSIPRMQIRNEFLNDEEKALLDEKKGLEVTLLQPCCRTIALVLKKWVMNNTFCYNLIGGWHKGVVENEANGLKPGSLVRFWAFRQDSKLCFSLVKVRDEED